MNRKEILRIQKRIAKARRRIAAGREERQEKRGLVNEYLIIARLEMILPADATIRTMFALQERHA